MSTFIICGTDTDVGKTVISALLVQGLGAVYWKPIQCGLENGGDTDRVRKLIDLPASRSIKEAYRFKAPVSPHWAAEKEHCVIDRNKLKIPDTKEPLLIETAGGLMVPLTRNWLQLDQLTIWKMPIILVARSGLGTLNHTLLSLEALRQRKLNVLGLIINGPHHQDNPTTLNQIGKVPILAEIPNLPNLTAEVLAEQWRKQNLHDVFANILNSIGQS